MDLKIAPIVILCLSANIIFAQNECSYERSDYKIKWEVQGDVVFFDLNFKPTTSGDFWTGIGFGRGMSDMDFIQVSVKGGSPSITDTYLGWYGAPATDSTQSVTMESGTFESGELKVRFYRDVNTGDSNDKPLDTCQYFQFPYSGGDISGGSSVRKHDRTPQSIQICNLAQRCKADPATSALPVPTTADNAPPVPERCRYNRGDYSIWWQTDETSVTFDLTFSYRSAGDFWTGIGFGGGMNNLDFIQVAVVGNEVKISDTYVRGYWAPYKDSSEDIVTESATFENGQLKARFSRPLDTKDATDALLTKCQVFQFPYTGGRITSGNRIGKHDRTPESEQKCNIAIDCLVKAEAETTTEAGTEDTVVTEASNVPDSVTPKDGCSFKSPGYELAWEVDGDQINFELKADDPPFFSDSGDFWSGIAFGPKMEDLDFIQVVLNSADSSVKLSDTYAQWRGTPSEDSQNDITARASSYENGQMRTVFARKLDTGDANDKPLNDCVIFQFPTSGGPVSGAGQVRMHYGRPIAKQFCDIAATCAKDASASQDDDPAKGEQATEAPAETEETTVTEEPEAETEKAATTAIVCEKDTDISWCPNYVTTYFNSYPTQSDQEKCNALMDKDNIFEYCCNTLVEKGCSITEE